MSCIGIDVSDYQGVVNWPQVAASGRQFAFAKATEGTTFVCKSFQANWEGIRDSGMVRGAYHFARPNANSPEDEADFFLAQVGSLEAGDLLALDLEAGDGDLADWASRWLQRVTDQIGFRPLLYSGAWFLVPHGCTTDDLAQYGLWLAAYRASAPAPPAPWSSLAFWQHTDAASVPGVDGNCDESYFMSDAGQLALYGRPADVNNSASSGNGTSAYSDSSAANPEAGDSGVNAGDSSTNADGSVPDEVTAGATAGSA